MHKINGAGHVDNEFVGEDEATNRPPTVVTPEWLNTVQRELVAAAVAGGLALDGEDDEQVITALKRIFAGNVRTIAVAGPTALTADDAGLVLVDAAANNVAITLPAVNSVTNAPLLFRFVRVDGSTNTVTVSRAGTDTLVGGATSFTLANQGDHRCLVGDADTSWATTAMSPGASVVKLPVRFTTTGDIALNGLGTQAGGDWGAALTVGDRILPKDQATGADRGIYIAAAGAWTRATDADGAGELIPGALVVVSEGVTLADTEWMLTTDAPITIGTTALTFAKQGGSSEKQVQSITATVAGNALTLGSAATTFDFRNPTITNGAPVVGVAIPAQSLVVPSGATLGTANGRSARLVRLVAYNAGTPVPCVVNLAGGVDLDESTLISPTTISGAANSANVIYSASAVAAGSPFRLQGYVDISEAVAGTWATAPTKVQGAGGAAMTAMGSIGFGQTWQDVSASRSAGYSGAPGPTYYNTTGRPIFVSASPNGSAVPGLATLTVNGVVAAQGTYAGTTGSTASVCGIVPPGASYSVSLSGPGSALNAWSELR